VSWHSLLVDVLIVARTHMQDLLHDKAGMSHMIRGKTPGQ
jgi:hypothetical protein